MQMAAGLDTGDMLVVRRVPIGENDNFEDIHDRLGTVGAEALLETLDLLEKGELHPVPQEEALATYAAKIEKADCLLDFSCAAGQVHDRVRGLSPIPLAFTHTPDGKLLKVLESRVSKGENGGAAPGTVLALGESITVACGKGCVELLRLLPEGKGRMSAADYVRGRRIAVGDILK
jgi:methionyl-tRNA formyltransferase